MGVIVELIPESIGLYASEQWRISVAVADDDDGWTEELTPASLIVNDDAAYTVVVVTYVDVRRAS
jgi:hypothetical protein